MTTHELTLFVSGIAIGACYMLLMGVVVIVMGAHNEDKAQ